MPKYSHSLAPAGLAIGILIVSHTIGCSRGGRLAAPGPAEVFVGKPITQQIVEWDEYVGRLEAVDFIEVRARVSGYLTGIYFDEGQIVKKGDLLFLVDPRPFEAEVASAKSDLAQAKAVVTEKEALQAQAEANRRASQARLDLAQQKMERVAELFRTQDISQNDYDVQAAELAQAQAVVEGSTAEIESAKAAIVTAQSAVITAEAKLQTAELDLEYTRVYSPIDGRMSNRMVAEGNLVSGGTAQSTLLTTIVSLDPIHCYFDADEQAFLRYSRLAREGKRASSREVKNPVFVRLGDEAEGFPHTGHMDFVDNRMDAETGTMRARAILSNPDLTMVPGLFVSLRLPGSGRYEAVLLPDTAIGQDQSEKFVYLVEKAEGGDTVRRQAIEIGPLVHGLRVIRKGLKGNEQVVLRGLQRARPGARIVAKEEATPPPIDDGLPDDYQPVPKEKWLSRPVEKIPPDPAQPPPQVPQSAPSEPSAQRAPFLPPPPPRGGRGEGGVRFGNSLPYRKQRDLLQSVSLASHGPPSATLPAEGFEPEGEREEVGQ